MIFAAIRMHADQSPSSDWRRSLLANVFVEWAQSLLPLIVRSKSLLQFKSVLSAKSSRCTQNTRLSQSPYSLSLSLFLFSSSPLSYLILHPYSLLSPSLSLPMSTSFHQPPPCSITSVSSPPLRTPLELFLPESSFLFSVPPQEKEETSLTKGSHLISQLVTALADSQQFPTINRMVLLRLVSRGKFACFARCSPFQSVESDDVCQGRTMVNKHTLTYMIYVVGSYPVEPLSFSLYLNL